MERGLLGIFLPEHFNFQAPTVKYFGFGRTLLECLPRIDGPFSPGFQQPVERKRRCGLWLSLLAGGKLRNAPRHLASPRGTNFR